MAELPGQVKAFYIRGGKGEAYQSGIEQLALADLGDGELLVKVAYSSVNYKDALAGTGKGKILRRFPLVGGIDLAGEVVESSHSDYQPGQAVLMTGCDLSETRDGGYALYQRIPAEWAIPLPNGLTAREAMILGTAGFTAALSLWRMEAAGQTPDMGPIVVTGATGGVGMLAINMLSKAGYEVHAISGKTDRFDFLQEIGASSCVSRHDLYLGGRPLEKGIWAGAIDNVGGSMLDGLTRCISPWGNIASCGLAGGHELHTTVMPFIIRGISLIGINSSGCHRSIREQLWSRLASDWKPPKLDKIATREITLEQLPEVFDTMLAGDSFGRTVVRVE